MLCINGNTGLWEDYLPRGEEGQQQFHPSSQQKAEHDAFPTEVFPTHTSTGGHLTTSQKGARQDTGVS